MVMLKICCILYTASQKYRTAAFNMT